MLTSKSDEKEKRENSEQSIKVVLRNARARAFIRTLIISFPIIFSFGIMVFLQSKLGFGLGFFGSSFTGIFIIVMYYYDKKRRNYSRFNLGGVTISILYIVMTWWLAVDALK